MDWSPISEVDLWGDINSAYERMKPEQRKAWEVIKIQPEKWTQEPWGNEGGGFWVVAIIGNSVIWFNDIEDGYNQSNYTKYGTINEYWCNQDELELAVQKIINMFKGGYDSAVRMGQPQEIT